MMTWLQTDWQDLTCAKKLLEQPGFAVKITNLVGVPIEKGFSWLPRNWKMKIGEATQSALLKAIHAASFTLRDHPGKTASNLRHKMAVAVTGGMGGFFGLPALALELPISTTIMLRSIADIARNEGEAIHTIAVKMACLEVFAFGGPSRGDDAAESGYFALRAALARSVSEAVEHLSGHGLIQEGAPALVRMIIQIAERFSIQVSEKAAAQAIPAIGAFGGAVVNTIFIRHFQDMARGHFIIRRLERKFGPAMVKAAYESI